MTSGSPYSKLSRAERELQRLAQAQRRLLVQVAPEVPGYQLSLAYRPSYVATGDYYDFFDRGNGRMAIFVGDGSGHGPTASVLMASMRAIMRTHPDLHGDPAATLAQAGRLFGGLTASDMFMTGLYLLLEGDGLVSWAAAGQDPPLRIDAAGTVVVPSISCVGMPLGILPDEQYETVCWKLVAGDRLVLFTDGLVEAFDANGQMFGRERFRACVAELTQCCLDDMVSQLVQRVVEHMKGAEFEDDFSIVAIERTLS